MSNTPFKKLGKESLMWGHRLDRQLQEARSIFENRHPYFRMFLWRASFVEVLEAPEEFTFATDPNLRIYYNKDFINGKKGKDLLYYVKHEFMHNVLSHFDRLKKYEKYMMGPYTLANIAGDLEINSKYFSRSEVPKESILPSLFGLPDGKSAEWYAEELIKQAGGAKKIMAESGAGSGDMIESPDGEGQFTDAEGKPNAPSKVGEWERQLMDKKMAEEIQKYQGNLPGDLADLANKILNSKIPWDRVLKSIIMRELDVIEGDTDYSRYPRKQMRSNVLEPSMVSPTCNIAILQDTSGSMWSDDTKVKCATETYGIIRAVKADVTWYAADTRITGKATLRSGQKPVMKWSGGGGTSMADAINEIAKTRRDLDLLVLITDCYTDWPKRPPFPVIVLCVGGHKDGVPKWVKKTIVYEES